MKKEFIISLLLILCCFQAIQAQDTTAILPPTDFVPPVPEEETSDTLFTVSEKELPDLRVRFKELNKEFVKPSNPTAHLLQLLTKDVLQMCPEALALIASAKDTTHLFDASVTFSDTIIVDPIFMPLVFRGNHLPEDLSFIPKDPLAPHFTPKPLYTPDSIFTEYVRRKETTERTAEYMKKT